MNWIVLPICRRSRRCVKMLLHFAIRSRNCVIVLMVLSVLSGVGQRRRWYNTARWKKLRKKVLEGSPLCAICHRQPATQCDHIVHTHNNARFWDRSNLRPACAECNNRLGAKARHARDRMGGRRYGKAGGGYVASRKKEFGTARGPTERDTRADLFATLMVRASEVL